MKRLIALALLCALSGCAQNTPPLPLAVRRTRKHPSNYGGVKQS